jgi:hypothetical protein
MSIPRGLRQGRVIWSQAIVPSARRWQVNVVFNLVMQGELEIIVERVKGKATSGVSTSNVLKYSSVTEVMHILHWW